MGVAVALVEDARGGKRNHVPAADTLDGPFDRAVGYRQFPDEGLIAALTVEDLTVDPQQGIGSRDFQKTAAYRADKVTRRAVFGIPFMFVIIAGDAEVLLKINLHPRAEVHQICEQILDIIFITVEIPSFKSQAVGHVFRLLMI